MQVPTLQGPEKPKKHPSCPQTPDHPSPRDTGFHPGTSQPLKLHWTFSPRGSATCSCWNRVASGKEWKSPSFPPDHGSRLGNLSWRLEEVRDDPGKSRAGGGGLEGGCRGQPDAQPLASQAKRHTPARLVALSWRQDLCLLTACPGGEVRSQVEPRGKGQLGSLLEKQQPLSWEGVGRQSCCCQTCPHPSPPTPSPEHRRLRAKDASNTLSLRLIR